MEQGNVEVIRFEDLEAVPWANGGGQTRVLAVDEAPDWAWRLSIADIGTPGAFSSYPGIDRVLVQLSAGRLVLDLDGESVHLGQFGLVAFDGALPVTCEIPDGPTRDLNLMTRRGIMSGQVRIETAHSAHAEPGVGEEAFAVVLDGSFSVTGEAAPLGPLDTVRCGHPASLGLSGQGTLAIVYVRPA